MDIEFDIQYSSFFIHHLNRDQIEYELQISFLRTETKAAEMKRFKIITANNSNRKYEVDLNFDRLRSTVDAEITRDRLKTRIVHLFARVKRLPDKFLPNAIGCILIAAQAPSFEDVGCADVI